MDLVGPISPSISKYRYILTLMDGFSRYVKTVPLSTKTAREALDMLQAQAGNWSSDSGWVKKGLRIGKFLSYQRETQSAAIFVQILSDSVMLQVPAGTRLGALNLTQRSHLARAVTSDPEDPPPSHQGASFSSQH